MKSKKILMLIALSGCLAASSCNDDIIEEITSLNLNRVLSPTDLTAQVVNRTQLRLNWKKVDRAETYNIEVYNNAGFNGTPVKKVDGITFSQLPYTITGFDGETEYFVRVQAIGEGIDPSKWITASFTTNPEQIFHEIDPAKLTANSATLNWPAGETVTTLTVSPGNITRTLTNDEIANGEVVITGLTSETTYTAKLMDGARTRGTIAFTTLLGEGVVKVAPTDDLGALIAAAEGGETFALEPGTYTINASVTISKSISIQGYKPSERPVIMGMEFKPTANAGLILKDLILDGTGSPANQTISYDGDSDDPYGDFVMENCEVKNYVKGLYYVNKKVRIPSVTFRGNIIYNIECAGGDFIDFRLGIADNFLFENNTVYNSALARDLFRMDAGGSTNFPSVRSVINIVTNTFYNVSNGNSRRFLYIRLANHEIHFIKNLIADTQGYYTNQASTTITMLSNNNYFNAPNFTGSTQSNAKNDTGTYTQLNPGFTNPAAADFTISNLDLKLAGIGDSRWR